MTILRRGILRDTIIPGLFGNKKNRYMKTDKECTVYGVTVQLRSFIDLLGAGFHPDTDFSDYVDAAGKPVFSKRGADLNNREIADCFSMCRRFNIDLYEIAANIFHEKLLLSL